MHHQSIKGLVKQLVLAKAEAVLLRIFQMKIFFALNFVGKKVVEAQIAVKVEEVELGEELLEQHSLPN